MAYLVEKIAESFKDFGVTHNYGASVTVSGVEVVPVSLVWLGYGGGNDQDENGGFRLGRPQVLKLRTRSGLPPTGQAGSKAPTAGRRVVHFYP